MADFDWRNPNYLPVFAARVARLGRLRATPGALPALKLYYRDHPESFVADWCCVQEPRNAAAGLPTTVPFVLWPRQRELVLWLLERWRRGENGIVAKSRDSGVTWLTTALACTLCLFHPGVVVGVASRKVEYVDGSPKSLLAKARFFLLHLPREFLGSFDPEKNAPFMRILFPATGSAITGEGGGQIGRGDRTSMTIVDEASFLEDPDSVDAALSQTTRSRIDVSTPNGRTGSFRGSGSVY
jgi:phage terminase large subunit